MNHEDVLARLAPNWQEHLGDGVVMDRVLAAISFGKHVPQNKCYNIPCFNSAVEGKTYCNKCYDYKGNK